MGDPHKYDYRTQLSTAKGMAAVPDQDYDLEEDPEAETRALLGGGAHRDRGGLRPVAHLCLGLLMGLGIGAGLHLIAATHTSAGHTTASTTTTAGESTCAGGTNSRAGEGCVGSTACGQLRQQGDVGSAGTSGSLWRAEATRSYSGARFFSGPAGRRAPLPPPAAGAVAATIPAVANEGNCSRWAVITSIFPPTRLVAQLAGLSGWCTVVVGDRRGLGAEEYAQALRALSAGTGGAAAPGAVVYLSARAQAEDPALAFATARALRWDHFGRKNLGYLFAISRGAQVVYDTDDDNELIDTARLSAWADALEGQGPGEGAAAGAGDARVALSLDAVRTCAPAFNAYPLFGVHSPSGTRPQFVWPRGFPLEWLRRCAASREAEMEVDLRARGGRQAVQVEAALANTSLRGGMRVPTARVGVLQSLANNDPDVDAIYRLRHTLPLDFAPAAAAAAAGPSGASAVALGAGTVHPINAQATLWRREALWALLLPVTVHGRVSDIWRGYLAQRLLWEAGLRVAVSAPFVRQVRNPHNYLRDFDAELPLFLRAGSVVAWLGAWAPPGRVRSRTALFAAVEALAVRAFEVGLVGAGDVSLTQAWLLDLEALGYGDDVDWGRLAAGLPGPAARSRALGVGMRANRSAAAASARGSA